MFITSAEGIEVIFLTSLYLLVYAQDCSNIYERIFIKFTEGLRNNRLDFSLVTIRIVIRIQKF